MAEIKVAIIEDNKYMQEGWKTFINYESDMEVLDCFTSCEAAFESEQLEEVDVMIMDIGLPGMSGIEGVKYLKQKYPEMVIIMASVFDDDDNVFNALKAGAVGYLMKKVSPEGLINAIRDAKAGGSPITPNIARKVIQTFHQLDTTQDLSEREQEILEQLGMGLSYGAIGKKIFLSVDGVRYHIRNIYEKLEVNSRSAAIAKGIQTNLIDPGKK